MGDLLLADGTCRSRRVMPLGIVVDERIASGGIYARAFAKAVGYLRNPELLEQPPETIRTETTMLPVSETRQINA